MGSAMSGDRSDARNARITLLCEEGVIHELQADSTPDQPTGTGKPEHPSRDTRASGRSWGGIGTPPYWI